MKKRALISVYDKTNIVEFAKKIQYEYGYEIVSTGATAECLKCAGINVDEVSSITNIPELLDGKVKTLHPNVFAGILADITLSEELNEIVSAGIAPFSMVVVNLYPFEEIALKTLDEATLIKNIDIGGCALLRAAAKNNKNILAVSSVKQYEQVLADMKLLGGHFSDELSKKFAQAAIANTASYDTCIAKTFAQIYDIENNSLVVNVNKSDLELRYGENPHQKSTLYSAEKVLDYEQLQGKALSYNNILDATAALGIASEFYDVNACAIIKHNNPCGVALGKSLVDAYQKALDCDPVSAFGGVVSFTSVVDGVLAKQLTSLFLELIIAPGYTDEALKFFETKKNLRVLKVNTPLKDYSQYLGRELKVTPFGILSQEPDVKQIESDNFKVVTKIKPTPEEIEDMVFAWKVAKHVKSNAIVIAKDFKTLGICGGQTSRIDALEIALNRACDGSKDAVLASDGFFPAVDNIQSAAQGRIKAIIQPGGSIKDNDVISMADKYSISMITTGIRHFKH